jgi:hypothetical protein
MSVLLAEADTVRPAKHVQKVLFSNLALVRIQSGHRSRTGHVSFAPDVDIHFPTNWSARTRLALLPTEATSRAGLSSAGTRRS